MRYVVSGDVDFDSFGMAPWDAGGRHGDSCQRRETFRTMMLQWLMRLLCRQAIMNGFNGTMRMNTEYGLDLRQMNGFTRIIGAICDCWTVGGCPQLDSAAADCGAVGLDDLIFHRTSFPPDELSAGRDRIYTTDCNTV